MRLYQTKIIEVGASNEAPTVMKTGHQSVASNDVPLQRAAKIMNLKLKNLRRVICGGTLTVTVAALSGCNAVQQKAVMASVQEPSETALALVVDPTNSAQYGQAQFLRDVQPILGGGYLIGGSVGIFRMDAAPHLKWAGPASKREPAQRAFAEAIKPTAPNSGTDPKTALEQADAWLASPKFTNYRKIVIVYSDLQNDPSHVNGQVKKFSDPLTMRWSCSDAEIHFYGLNQNTAKAIARTRAKAWKNLKFPPRSHQPNEMFLPGDVGLSEPEL